jgi:ribose transport system ATP-binding protein
LPLVTQALGTGSGTRTGSSDPVLSLQRITKTYPGTRALVDVSFDLRAGEVHGLVGENGAGKSTLMKVISGVVQPDQGAIVLRGQPHRQHLTPRSALALGISTIYQESDIVTSLTVADNVFLGQEPARAGDFVDVGRQRRITRALIGDLGVDLDPDELGARLSPAQRQLTMIVRALRFDPDVLVLDEPTSSLGQAETEHLLALVRRLADRGIGIIYISHYLDEIMRVADRITVLKDGQHVATMPAAEASAERLVHLMVGRSASAFFVKEKVPIGDVLMRVEGYSGPGILEPVSFEVRRGEVLGFGGLVGAGRTELLELLFGVRKPRSGTIHIGPRDVRPQTPREAVAVGISLVTEDRAHSGLFPDRTVRENLAAAWNELRGPVVRGERALADGIVDRLSIVTPSVEQEVKRLSGGNQQKVLIGRWLAVDAQVYMFDEPTKGVDIGAKHDIYRFIAELLRAGRGVVLVSSDLPELLSISDRIAVMRQGRIVSIVEAIGATEQGLMKEFLGVTGD